MLALQADITLELTKRAYTVTWRPDGVDQGWPTNTVTFIEDNEKYIIGQMTGKQIVDTLYLGPRPVCETRDFVMMLHALPEECVRRRVDSDEPAFVLYYHTQ